MTVTTNGHEPATRQVVEAWRSANPTAKRGDGARAARELGIAESTAKYHLAAIAKAAPTIAKEPQRRPPTRTTTPAPTRKASRWELAMRRHDPVAYLLLAVAGAVSYHHIVQLALAAGADWWAWVLPLSLDGMMLAAGRRRSADRKANRKAHRPAAVALGLGAVLSLLCNAGAVLARVRPELVPLDWVLVGLALVPPLAVLMYVQLTDRGYRR